MGRGEGKVNFLRVKPIFKPKIDQADHFRPKSCYILFLTLNKVTRFCAIFFSQRFTLKYLYDFPLMMR